MYEVELKVRAEHESVRSALERRGATRVGSVEQVDTYYDAPHRDFATTDEALRVRREVDASETEATRLTYKGPIVDDESKTRREIETPVDDEDMDAILRALGFDPAATVEKERERWTLDDYAVSLDAVAGLGQFVEVEAEATESEIESVREGAANVLRDIGLNPEEGIQTSYLGLLLEAGDDESTNNARGE